VLHTSRVHSGSGAFTAHLRGPWKRLHGRARISLANVRVSARGVLVQGNARIDARIASFNPRRSADLSGTRFSIDDGRLVPDMEVSPGWWARGVLPRAHIAFVDPRLDANVRAQCRDARPIVGIYSHLEDLPGFVKGMFTMDGLTLRGSAHAGRGWLVVPDVKAQGESASVEATLLREGDVQRGAALLTVHGISVALDLHDGGSDLHIFGPGGFFADRQREVLAQPMGRRTPPLRH
jgi:hypothetical protein